MDLKNHFVNLQGYSNLISFLLFFFLLKVYLQNIQTKMQRIETDIHSIYYSAVHFVLAVGIYQTVSCMQQLRECNALQSSFAPIITRALHNDARAIH